MTHFYVNIKYPDGHHEEELLQNIVATSHADAEKQAIKIIMERRGIPRAYIRARAINAERWGISNPQKDTVPTGRKRVKGGT